jgi:hypothetical protein
VKINPISATVPSHRGALAIVIDAGRDAVDAENASDEGICCGRQSRVVLAPRRRRQVSRRYPRDDGDQKARAPGRARTSLLTPLRAGMPGDSGGLVVTMLVCFLHFARETAGALGARHSPRPYRGGSFLHDPGKVCRGNADVCRDVCQAV